MIVPTVYVFFWWNKKVNIVFWWFEATLLETEGFSRVSGIDESIYILIKSFFWVLTLFKWHWRKLELVIGQNALVL